MAKNSPFIIAGYSSYQNKIAWTNQLFARLFDFSLIILLTYFLLRSFLHERWWSYLELTIWGSSALAFFLLHQVYLPFSFGFWLWEIRSDGVGEFKQVFSFSPLRRLFIFIMSLGLAFALTQSVQHSVLENPLWQSREPRILAVYRAQGSPELSELPEFEETQTLASHSHGKSEWAILPFFYTIGAWPKRFEGHAVHYSLPYQKGPPNKFVGQVVAHWSEPEIKIIIEGPRTPRPMKALMHASNALAQIRGCFLSSGFSLNCHDVRRQSLERHYKEAEAFGANKYSWEWFQVQHPGITLDEQTQGLHLKMQGTLLSQDRFIVFTPSGSQQAFILQHPSTSIDFINKNVTYDLFEKSIRSIRVFSELDSGRAWIHRMLSLVRLDQIPIQNLQEVQALLISKISVDPKSFDTYYHLGGTSVLLSGAKNHFALQNLMSSLRFAQDIAPENPKLSQLESWVSQAEEIH